MSIFDVQHQERGQRIIQQALACRRMPHAYLFAGPEGVGREMLAVRLAQLMLCEKPVHRDLPVELADAIPKGRGLDGCGTCADCRLIEAGTHPDLHVVYRQLNRQHPESRIRKQKALDLSVDVIRHFVVEQTVNRPMRGRAKVFILREAERLNDNAQNCLLKTLEEPPSDTFLILVTTALDRMLPTTRSRCQQVPFHALPASFVAERLSDLRPDADSEAVHYVARHVEGRLGLAVQMLDDGLYPLKQAWGERLMEMAGSGRGVSAHGLAAPMQAEARQLAACVSARDRDVSDTDALRTGLRMLLACLADFYRDALHLRVGSTSILINRDQPAVIERLAQGSPGSIVGCLKRLSEADANLGRNAHIELTLDTLFLHLAAETRGVPIPSSPLAAG